MKKTYASIINYRRSPYLIKFLKHILIAAFAVLFANRSFADYTVATGQNIDASTITGQSGVLTVNGTLTVSGNQSVSLSGFTSVIINCPGQIYWTGNGNLTFAGGTSVNVVGSSTNCGLQPTGGSASAALVIGGITIAVSNDNSNNAAYSFAQFNSAGGLAAFTYTGISPVCYGSSPSVTLTPIDHVVNFNCTFTISSSPSVTGASISPASVTKFQGAQTATLTPASSASPVTYTISCKITRTLDVQQDPIAIKTFTITVNPKPTTPTALAATPCLGSSATINATTNPTAWQWQVSTNGGSSWSNLSNTSPYSGVTTSALGVSPTSPAMTSYYYRAQATNSYQDYTGAYCNATSGAVPLRFINEWLGTSSTNYSTPANWINNTLPNFSGGCPTATIPAVSTLPQLSADVSVTNLSIAPGAYLDLNGHTLTMSGVFSGSSTGYLKGSTSSGLTISGTTGSLYFDQTTNGATNALKNLTISSGTAILGNALNIAAGTYANPGTLTANGILNANGNLTIKSDINGDARIGQSSGKINGNVTVERFIPARRAWRYMAIPFSSTSQTIRDAWQEGVNNYGLDAASRQNPHPGFGTHITGNNHSDLGFDFNNEYPLNPSLKVWNAATNGFDATEPSTISTNIQSRDAYIIFVRGSRAVDLSLGTAAPTDNTTLRIKGILNETGLNGGNISKTYSGASGGFILVGNPFASSINMQNILNGGTRGSGFVLNKLWVWDPKLGSVGAYVTWTSGVWAPNTGSYPGNSGTLPILQSGQAFLVQLTAGSTGASMTFSQSDKISTEGNVTGRSTNNAKPAYPNPVVYANLMSASGDSLSLLDGVAAVFNNMLSKKADAVNAPKNWNYYENMSLLRNGQNFAIEFRPISTKDTLFFGLDLRKNQPYALQIFSQNIPDSMKGRALLVDKYLKTQKPVNLSDKTIYSFTATADSNSYRNRFMLVFNNHQQSLADKTNILTGDSPNVGVFPNPVTGHSFMIQLGNFKAGKYEALIYNNKGTLVFIKELQHTGNNGNYKVIPPSAISSGAYNLVLKKDNVIVKTVSLVIAE